MFARLTPMLSLFALLSLASACNGGGNDANPSISVKETGNVLPDTSSTDPANPGPVTYSTQVMLFNGTGVSTSDWQTTEQIIKDEGLTYQLVNSAELNAMTVAEMATFGMMVVPGGHGGSIAGSITNDTQLRLRSAVRDYGLSYVGFCAGAWVAVGPEATGTAVAGYGFALAPGNVLDLFMPGGQSPTAAMVATTFADGSHRQLVWWGGPITPEWNKGVIARYDSGVPAISETFSGKGLVIVSGPHPEAPQGWRATAGYDSDGLDYDIAIKLIKSALNKQPLPTF